MSVKNIARNLLLSGALMLTGTAVCGRFVSANLTNEDYQQRVEECASKVIKCKRETEEYEQRIEECKEDAEELKRKSEECREALYEYEQKAVKCEWEIEECKQEVEEYKQKTRKCEEALYEYDQKAAEYEWEIKECKEDVRRFAQEIEEYDQEVEKRKQLADCWRDYGTCLIDSFRFSNNATEDVRINPGDLHKCNKYLEWCFDGIESNVKEDNAKAKAHMFL